VSLTVTSKKHVAVLLEASVAVQLPGVVATGKKEPCGGVHVTVTPGQLSEAKGAG